MTKSVTHRLAEVVRPKSKRNFAVLKRVGGAHIRPVLIVAVVFGFAYAIVTKAILALESSQDLFEVMR
jgi:hypothetical protein